MKKLLKFIVGVASIAALAYGAYYFFKKYICKETADDFDDFDDELEDFDTTDDCEPATENREYVSINITADQEDTEKAVANEDANQQEP